MNEQTLDWALPEADIPILLMVLVHLTGDTRWIQPPFTPVRDVRLFPDESGGLAEDVQKVVRSAAARALSTPQQGSATPSLSEEILAQMMSTCVGEEVSGEYVPLFLEEIGLRPRAPTGPSLAAEKARPTVLIIGAGFSGLCAAIECDRAGIDYLVVDKNDEIGGTWWENVYPESGVDTPNHFYSYSFRPNPRWTSYFSKQPEVLAYIQECAAHFDLRPRIRLGTEVLNTRWAAEQQRWETTVRGPEGNIETLVSTVVIAAVGQLNRPSIPDFEGIDGFDGPLFHTAQWPADLELAGKRVVMVGNGASAVQLARSVAERAAHLTVIQRSPQWVAPNPDYHRTVNEQKTWLLENVPFYAQWYRFVRFWRYGDGLHRTLFVDPSWDQPSRSINSTNDRHRSYLVDYLEDQLEGRADLVTETMPDYPPYAKRMLVDNEWFKTLRRDDVTLVTRGVQRITDHAIETLDGESHPADVIIMATGFKARGMVAPIEVTGLDGWTLTQEWADDNARAYLGISVPKFPNFFMMHGPNTALAHGGSVIFHAECQTRYIVDLLRRMAVGQIGSVSCRSNVYLDYVQRVDNAHAQMVWTHPAAISWYRNQAGRVVSVSPWRLVDYWAMTREADLNDYDCEPAEDGANVDQPKRDSTRAAS